MQKHFTQSPFVIIHHHDDLSRNERTSEICLCENEGADQLCSDCTADQRLCFRYIVQSFPFSNTKFQASSLSPRLYSPVCVRPGATWSEISKPGFLTSRPSIILFCVLLRCLSIEVQLFSAILTLCGVGDRTNRMMKAVAACFVILVLGLTLIQMAEGMC